MSAPPDEHLNLIYNAVDVGITTSNGEGWGLVPFEHALCRKPQVVPDHTSCRDIWKNSGMLIEVAAWITDKDLGVERGIVDYKHAAKLLSDLYDDKDLCKEIGDKCYQVTQNPSFRWDKVAEGFNKALQEVA